MSAGSREMILAVLSRAGIAASEIEKAAGLGHGTLNKALEGNRNLSLDHFRAVVVEVGKRDREAARTLLDWFADPAGYVVIEGAPGGGEKLSYVRDVNDQLEFVGKTVSAYADGAIDECEYRELRRTWRAVSSRIEARMQDVGRKLDGHRCVVIPLAA